MTDGNQRSPGLRRKTETETMWSTIDPLMQRRFEQASEKKDG